MQRVYKTERLILKVIDRSCAELVIDYYLRNKAFLKEWETEKDDEFYTIQYQEEQLDKELAYIENNYSIRLWIFKRNDESKIIGSVLFYNYIRAAFLSCHMGVKLDKDEVNKGYMTEACQKGIEIIFNEFGMHRIEVYIMPKNKCSLGLVEKLGFNNEGLAYKYCKINGKWEDLVRMVLINDAI